MLLKVCSIIIIIASGSSLLQALDAADTSLSSAGDPAKGKRVFNRCKACHNLTPSARTRLGPNLDKLFGKKAGAEKNYKYSKALTEANIIWTEMSLNEWLTKPNAFLPGNKMAFAGIRREQDRKDLIAFLRQSTSKTE